jgi:predicted N-formylglutamate amidohydrolase
MSPPPLEPPLVELANPEGRAPLLIACDHAGSSVPARLGALGLPPTDLERHIAYDIGAAWVTCHLARLLDAPAVLCHVSRLVIDVNRPPAHPTSIPQESDGTAVPGNRDLSPEERRRRLFGSFVPYHRVIARRLARFRREGVAPTLIAVHSFTPRMNGTERPWQIGVLSNQDRRLADLLLDALRARAELMVGDNEPYTGRGELGFTARFHAERQGLAHVMLELRQDLIATREAARPWAELLAEALRQALARQSPLPAPAASPRFPRGTP